LISSMEGSARALPLFVFHGSTDEAVVVPLPASHLPDEVSSTLHLYGMELRTPLYKLLMEETIAQAGGSISSSGVMEVPHDHVLYGHIATTPNNNTNSLVGAIGCTARILVSAPSNSIDKQESLFNANNDDTIYYNDFDTTDTTTTTDNSSESITVLVQGCYRFIVTEMIQTVPYPIAMVKELFDTDVDADSDTSSTTTNNKDEEEDELDNVYSQLTPNELKQRTLGAMKTIIDQQLKNQQSVKPPSPLELSILETYGGGSSTTGGQQEQQQDHVEELAAVYHVFVSTLSEYSVTQQYYAIAMIGGEMADFDNVTRTQLLTITCGVERLRLVCREMERKIGYVQATQLTNAIVEESTEVERDLMVGEPVLPPWAKRIRVGTQLEYYWNEEYEWCSATVLEEPVVIVDEILITVQFDMDEAIYRLPFRADEKARWRPL